MNEILKLSAIALLTIGVTSGAQAQKGGQDNEARIEALIKQMSLEEKIGMIHANSSFTSAGVSRLGIPELVTSDGPHGVRPEHGRDWELDNKGGDSSTYLPVGISLASTWNERLGYEFGAVLGSEARFRGKDIILGPGINIMRTPLNGRNFEYMSEDPCLISKMVVGYIKGVQDQGVSACVKHFIANNQEIRRDGINVEMSNRALHEIYLPGFKAAVTIGKVNSVMGAYNKFRGEYCTYNDFLVNRLLKGEWQFDGVMMSDWGAIHHTREALLGGADLEMGTDLAMLPNPDFSKFFFADAALKAVRDGSVPADVIDDKVRRILRIMFRTKLAEGRTKGAYGSSEHADVARRVAEEALVLLKNNKQLLPLHRGEIKQIALIGGNASREHAMGGGSSQVRARYEITPLKGLQGLLGSDAGIRYEQGYAIASGGGPDEGLIEKAVDAARTADVAIIVGGWVHGYDYSKWSDNAYDAEGVDKPNITLPFGQDELIKAVSRVNKRVIVVLYGGGPADIRAWETKVGAILFAGYPGQEGGTALARVLFGEVNPSGKLTVTFPQKLEDAPAHKIGEYPGDSINVRYKDDIWVGYRYYDTYREKPMFPFGHGLSYTKFSYGKPRVERTGDSIRVSLILKNSGRMAGAEVVQLYVSARKASVERPVKELKSFKKIWLQPGEERELNLMLGSDAFNYFDESQDRWMREPGVYRVLLGSSSSDIRSSGQIKLDSL